MADNSSAGALFETLGMKDARKKFRDAAARPPPAKKEPPASGFLERLGEPLSGESSAGKGEFGSDLPPTPAQIARSVGADLGIDVPVAEDRATRAGLEIARSVAKDLGITTSEISEPEPEEDEQEVRPAQEYTPGKQIADSVAKDLGVDLKVLPEPEGEREGKPPESYDIMRSHAPEAPRDTAGRKIAESVAQDLGVDFSQASSEEPKETIEMWRLRQRLPMAATERLQEGLRTGELRRPEAMGERLGHAGRALTQRIEQLPANLAEMVRTIPERSYAAGQQMEDIRKGERAPGELDVSGPADLAMLVTGARAFGGAPRGRLSVGYGGKPPKNYSLKNPPPKETPLPDAAALQRPESDWHAKVSELDARNAPDGDYRLILSAGSKETRANGAPKNAASWRDRIVGILDTAAAKQGGAREAPRPVEAPPVVDPLEAEIGQAARESVARGPESAPVTEAPLAAPPAPDIGAEIASVARENVVNRQAQPARPFIQQQEDLLHKLRTNAEADVVEMGKRVNALPPSIKQMDEKFYHNIEDPVSTPLNPQEQAVFNAHLNPLKIEERQLYTDLKTFGYPDKEIGALDPNYMHRMVKGKTRTLDEIVEGGPANPIYGGRSLSSKPASTKERKVFAIEDDAGTRHIVTEYPGSDALYLWRDGKRAKVEGGFVRLKPEDVVGGTDVPWKRTIDRPVVAKAEGGRLNLGYIKPGGKETAAHTTDIREVPEHYVKGEFKPGDTFVDLPNNRQWQIKQATTREIEQAGVKNSEGVPLQYYKSAVAGTVENVLALRRALRNAEYLEQLKATPEFRRFAVHGERPKGWKPLEIPQLQGYYAHPRIANALNDYYKGARAVELGAMLDKVNRLAVGSIFWNPIPHIQNVGAHWYVARGWDNFTPRGMKSLLVDGTRALKEVVTQGPEYLDVMRQGGAMISSGVRNRGFVEVMLKKLGQDIERDASKWAEVARIAGYTGVPQMVKAIYNTAAKVLWMSNDVFLLQRVFELERKGMSRIHAIRDAERHIPNYRVPSEILGSRAMSVIMQDPNLTMFGRYHYGMFKSYAQMVRDVVKGSGKERWEATGNLMALGLLLFVAYPVMNAAIQLFTGNKDAKMQKRGAATFPLVLKELTEGQIGFAEALQHFITPAQGTKELLQQFTNTDIFTKQPIGTGGVVQNIYERGRHATGAVVAPVGQAQQVAKRGLSPMLLQQLGISSPPEETTRLKEYYLWKNAKGAQRRGQGAPFERLYGGTQ